MSLWAYHGDAPMPRTAVIPLALSSLLLLGAAADSRLEFARSQLASAKDPRLRAQAALVLAALKSPQAIPPLCASLADPSPLVRAAAARALGSVAGAGAKECLRRHRETDSAARAEVSAALAALEARARPRVYVSLGTIQTTVGKLSPDAEVSAERELRAALQKTEGVLVAPRGENPEAARAVIERGGLRAYQFSVSLKAEPGGVVSMDVLFLRYPDRTMLEEVELGAQGGDPETLIRLLAPRVVDRAAKMLEWSQP